MAVDLGAVPPLAGLHARGERGRAGHHGLLVSTFAVEDLGSSSTCECEAVGVAITGRLGRHLVEDHQGPVSIAGEPRARRLPTMKLT